MPPTLAAIDDVQTIVRIAEAASYHEPFLAAKAERYGKTNVRRDVEAGSLITAVQYLRAQKVRAKFVREFTALFNTFDVFLTPGFPAPAGEPSECATAVPARVQCVRLSGLVAAGGLLDDARRACRWRCRLPPGRGPKKRSTRPRPPSNRPPAGIASARALT